MSQAWMPRIAGVLDIVCCKSAKLLVIAPLSSASGYAQERGIKRGEVD